MTNVRDVNAHAFIKAYAAFLKKSGKVTLPKWVEYAKTGAFKELGPLDNDWFYIRCASLARHIYLRKGVGVGALKKAYGGARRNGVRPNHHADAAGSVIRKALQTLEKLRVLEQCPDGGRMISIQGQKDLDRIAAQIAKSA